MSDFYIDNKGIIGVPPGIPGSLPSKHAKHHITGGTDVIPNATDVNSGLMSPTDKQKLDAITQEKIDTWNTVTEKANKVDVYTKSEVNNLLSQAGYGDMMKATYDADNDGVVDLAKDADTLDGKHYSDIKNEIEIKYATASGTNNYTVTISGITAYTEGLSVKIKFTNANTGASTLNINGLGAKNIVKSNGNPLSSGNIKAGQICHLVYTGSVFQLLGEGGEYGTAQPEHVLEGYTIGTENGIVSGTMPNRGAINQTITTQSGQIIIPEGYHDGNGKVTAYFANLTSENIRYQITIGGVTGTLGRAKSVASPDTNNQWLTVSAYSDLSDGEARVVGRFKPNVAGAITVGVTVYHGTYNATGTFYISFYNNGVYAGSTSHYMDTVEYATALRNISVSPNDTVEIRASYSGTSSAASVSMYRIYFELEGVTPPVAL